MIITCSKMYAYEWADMFGNTLFMHTDAMDRVTSAGTEKYVYIWEPNLSGYVAFERNS